MASGTNYLILERLVNPWQNLVFASSNDFSSSWGVPADGPTAPIIRDNHKRTDVQ